MPKRSRSGFNFYNAFGTARSLYGAGQSAYNAYKRYRKTPSAPGKMGRFKRSTRQNFRRRFGGSLTRTFTKTKRRRGRFIRKRRQRAYRNFAKKLDAVAYPPRQYRSQLIRTLTQSYNQQKIEFLDEWMTYTTLNDISNEILGVNLDPAAPDLKPSFTINKYGMSMEIINHSPSRTYLQIYWMICRDTNNEDPQVLIDSSEANLGFAGHVLDQLSLTSRVRDFKYIFKYWKCLKKSYHVMEGGAVAKAFCTRKRPYYVRSETLTATTPTQTYQKGLTIVPLVRVWSQYVKNHDLDAEHPAGNDLFVADNAIVGFKMARWAYYSRRTKPAYVGPLTYLQYNAAVVPEVYTDIKEEKT